MRFATARRSLLLLLLVLLAAGVVVTVGARERSGAQLTEAQERALTIEVPFAGRLRALQLAEYGPPELAQTWEYRITFIAPEGSEV